MIRARRTDLLHTVFDVLIVSSCAILCQMFVVHEMSLTLRGQLFGGSPRERISNYQGQRQASHLGIYRQSYILCFTDKEGLTMPKIGNPAFLASSESPHHFFYGLCDGSTISI